MSTIHISLSPNTQWDDVTLSLRALLQPWMWRGDAWRTQLEQTFARDYGLERVHAFESGRSALTEAIHALELQGQSIAVQAWSCIAVPNAVKFAGAKPVFVDADRETGSMSLDALRALKTPIAAVLIQYNFGITPNMDELVALCRERGWKLIEDCAHTFSAQWNGKHIGMFGDAAIWSFGRDKALSSVFGGVAYIHDTEARTRLEMRYRACSESSYAWIAQQLVHPLVTSIARITYSFGIGKIILAFGRVTRIISRAVEPAERQGREAHWARKRLSNALARLALHQWRKRERLDNHRRVLQHIYQQAPISKLPHLAIAPQLDTALLRFCVFAQNRDELLSRAKSRGWILGDWYTSLLAPYQADTTYGLRAEDFPNAHWLAQHALNLPTHIHASKKNAHDIAQWLSQNT